MRGLPWIAVLMCITPASTLATTPPPLRDQRTLRCEWERHSIAEWRDGGVSAEIGAAGLPTYMYDKIDLEKRSALLAGNAGIEPVEVIPGSRSIHLVELTDGGNLAAVTVFDEWDGKRGFPAVHSRHMRFGIGSPVVSQYYGWCAPPGFIRR